MNNLDQINMFIAFLELVQNPAKYTEMLKEMKEHTNAYKEYVEAYVDVKQANKYFDKLKAEQTAREVEFANKVKSTNEALANATKDLEHKQAEFDKKKDSFAKQLQELAVREEEINLRDKQVEAAFIEIAKQKTHLQEKEVGIVERESKLTEKEAKLKAVLGS